MASAAPTISIQWGSATGTASNSTYNKISPIIFTNFTSGTMVINFSISMTRPYSTSALGSVTKYTNGTSLVVVSNVSLPYSTTTSITVTPGQTAQIRMKLSDQQFEDSHWENLDFVVTITSATISGVPVTIGSNYIWHME